MSAANAARVRELNDQFRKSFIGGRILLTHSVTALPSDQLAKLIAAVKTFDSFTEDNGPYGEHDFGTIEIEHQRCFFKIDYYDPSMTRGTEDAADTSKTVRVLTIMLAEEC